MVVVSGDGVCGVCPVVVGWWSVLMVLCLLVTDVVVVLSYMLRLAICVMSFFSKESRSISFKESPRIYFLSIDFIPIMMYPFPLLE